MRQSSLVVGHRSPGQELPFLFSLAFMIFPPKKLSRSRPVQACQKRLTCYHQYHLTLPSALFSRFHPTCTTRDTDIFLPTSFYRHLSYLQVRMTSITDWHAWCCLTCLFPTFVHERLPTVRFSFNKAACIFNRREGLILQIHLFCIFI